MANTKETGRNRVLVAEAQQALEKFKTEVANELGLSNYAQQDKGELTSRQNGYVGGIMVKKMISQAEQQMSTSGSTQFANTQTDQG